MSDNDVRDLARRAGVELKWTDYADKPRDVPLDTVRNILAALGMPCQTNGDIAQSRRILDETGAPCLVTALVGHAIDLPCNLRSRQQHALTDHGRRKQDRPPCYADDQTAFAYQQSKSPVIIILEIGNKTSRLRSRRRDVFPSKMSRRANDSRDLPRRFMGCVTPMTAASAIWRGLPHSPKPRRQWESMRSR